MSFARCTHLRINGARCAMPAANGGELCYDHESRRLRLRARPSLPSSFPTVPLVGFVYPEDHAAILENIHAISRALSLGEIDYRQASVMDRIMNTALRTLRQGKKLEETVTSKEMITHFRVDEDGNARAIDNPTESAAEPDSSVPVTLPTVLAVAESPQSNQQQTSYFQSPAEKSRITPLFPALRQSRKLSNLFSTTCDSETKISGGSRDLQVPELNATK